MKNDDSKMNWKNPASIFDRSAGGIIALSRGLEIADARESIESGKYLSRLHDFVENNDPAQIEVPR